MCTQQVLLFQFKNPHTPCPCSSNRAKANLFCKVILAVSGSRSFISANPKGAAFTQVPICRAQWCVAALFLKADLCGAEMNSKIHPAVVPALGCFQVPSPLTFPHSRVPGGDSLHEGRNVNAPSVHGAPDSARAKRVLQIPSLPTHPGAPKDLTASC